MTAKQLESIREDGGEDVLAAVQLEGLVEHGQHPLDGETLPYGQQEVPFSWKVEVDRAFREPGPARDAANRGTVVTAGRELTRRGIQDLGPTVFRQR